MTEKEVSLQQPRARPSTPSDLRRIHCLTALLLQATLRQCLRIHHVTALLPQATLRQWLLARHVTALLPQGTLRLSLRVRQSLTAERRKMKCLQRWKLRRAWWQRCTQLRQCCLAAPLLVQTTARMVGLLRWW